MAKVPGYERIQLRWVDIRAKVGKSGTAEDGDQSGRWDRSDSPLGIAHTERDGRAVRSRRPRRLTDQQQLLADVHQNFGDELILGREVVDDDAVADSEPFGEPAEGEPAQPVTHRRVDGTVGNLLAVRAGAPKASLLGVAAGAAVFVGLELFGVKRQ